MNCMLFPHSFPTSMIYLKKIINLFWFFAFPLPLESKVVLCFFAWPSHTEDMERLYFSYCQMIELIKYFLTLPVPYIWHVCPRSFFGKQVMTVYGDVIIRRCEIAYNFLCWLPCFMLHWLNRDLFVHVLWLCSTRGLHLRFMMWLQHLPKLD